MRTAVGLRFILATTFILIKCEEHVINKKYANENITATVTEFTTELFKPETVPTIITTEAATEHSQSIVSTQTTTQKSPEKNTDNGKLFIIDLSDIQKTGDKMYKESKKAEEQTKSLVSSIFETLQQASDQIMKSLNDDEFSKYYGLTLDTPSISIIQPKRSKREAKCTNTNGPQCNKEGYFRLNQSCIKFYQCEFDPKCDKLVSKIRTCPRCLKFNAETNICDLPQNVPECSYMKVSPKHFCTGIGKFFIPDDCGKYYDCKESTNSTKIKLTIKTCPQHTTFSQKDRLCVKKKRCNRHIPTCGPGKFYLGDKFDCGNFYYCITKNQTAPLACPSNFVFDGQGCKIFEKSKLNWEKIKKRFRKQKNKV